MNLVFQGSDTLVLDAKDLRTLYNIPTPSPGAAGLTLVVLGTQEGTQSDPKAVPAAPWIPARRAGDSYVLDHSGWRDRDLQPDRFAKPRRRL